MYLSRGKFNKKKRGESIAMYWSTVVQLYQSKNKEPKGKGEKMKKRIMRQEEIVQAFKDHGGTVTFDKDIGLHGAYICKTGGTINYLTEWLLENDGEERSGVELVGNERNSC